jgi:hypothetical protein
VSWLELDDGILDHPKFIRAVKLAGSETIHLWLGLRSYCGKLLTDGFVPEDMLDEVRGPRDPKKRIAALSALKAVGLIDDAKGGGVRMHNYLKWSKSKKQVLEQREAARKRQTKFRSGNGGSDDGSDGSGNAGGNAVTKSVTNSAVPSTQGEEWSGVGNGLDLDLGSGARVGNDAGIGGGELQTKATVWIEDPTRASLTAPQPEKWPEMRRLFSLVTEVFGGPEEFARTSHDDRVKAVLRLWAEGRTSDELERAIRGSGLDPYYRGNPQFQNLKTILKDSAQVDKFIRLLTVAPVATVPPAAAGRGAAQLDRQLARVRELEAKAQAEPKALP